MAEFSHHELIDSETGIVLWSELSENAFAPLRKIEKFDEIKRMLSRANDEKLDSYVHQSAIGITAYE